MKIKSAIYIAVTLLLLSSIITPGYALLQEEQPKDDELGGITLGFSMEQVKKLLGTPQSVSELKTDKEQEIVWEYKNKGIKILFRNEQAEVIILQAPCVIPTPRGLKIGDDWKKSLEVYQYYSAYVQNLGYQIGIVFTLQDGIKLSVAVPRDTENITTISLWREK